MAQSLEVRQLTIDECIPDDLTFLSAYQTQAYQQILWDEQGHTIQGSLPRAYMRKGIHEELEETTGEDKVEPLYNRFNALLLLPQAPVEPEVSTPTALQRHTKEFGDVSWYLANYLSLYNLDMSQAAKAGKIAWTLDRVASPRGTDEFVLDVERKFPWGFYFGASHELKIAVDAINEVRSKDERIGPEKQLMIASGKYITSMMHIAASRFGITYESILNQNKDKLAKRIIDNTVFDKSGGDDR